MDVWMVGREVHEVSLGRKSEICISIREFTTLVNRMPL